MNVLLDKAKQKRKGKNILPEGALELPIYEFILENYNACDPSSCGNNIQKKIISDNSHILNKVSGKDNIGDFNIQYPNPMILVINGWIQKWNIDNCIVSHFFEAKSSYSNPFNICGIKNIRFYQDVNLYVICLVDCENDFKEHFFVVSKQNLMNNFTISQMFGTKEVNLGNKNLTHSISFNVNDGISKLSKINILKNSSFDELNLFLFKFKVYLRHKFFESNKPLELYNTLSGTISDKKLVNYQLYETQILLEDYVKWIKFYDPNILNFTEMKDAYNQCKYIKDRNFAIQGYQNIIPRFNDYYNKLMSLKLDAENNLKNLAFDLENSIS